MQTKPQLPSIFLTGAWRWLVMLNFEIDPAILAPRVPRGTQLDFHDGKCFVSLVGFLFRDTRVLGISIPWHGDFEEVNLRFYVRHEVAGEVRRGVVFIREIVPRTAIAIVAQWAYNEPYIALPMRHSLKLPGGSPPTAEQLATPTGITYQWLWRRKWNELHFEPEGEGALPSPGSHAEFITEHYFGYTAQRNGATVEYRVEHPTWRQWQSKNASFNVDVSSLYGEQFAPFVQGKPFSAFMADGSPIIVRRPSLIT
jgi:uncharacterized protein YqjF (DUF2071 family)